MPPVTVVLLCGLLGQPGVALHDEAGESTRFMWGHVDLTMGFGDKLNYYKALLATATAVGRTAVLPPFEIQTYNYSSIASFDIAKYGKDRFDKVHPEAHGSFSFLDEKLYVPVEEWFDLEAMQAASGIPMISYSEWLKRTGGVIDFAYVPSLWHGVAPAYDQLCAAAAAERRLWLDTGAELPLAPFNIPIKITSAGCLHGITLDADDIHMDDTYFRELLSFLAQSRYPAPHRAGASAELSTESPAWSGLDPAPLRAAAERATTLGAEAFGLRMRLPPDLNALITGSSLTFRFLPARQVAADTWISEHGLKRFMAVHWRRGDVQLDHTAFFINHTPENMINAIADMLAQRGEEALSYDAIFLLTDNFVLPEIGRFERLAADVLQLRVYQYHPNVRAGARDRTTQHPMTEKLFMDLIIASRSELLTSNYWASNFAGFAQSLRELDGKDRGSYPPLTIAPSPQHTGHAGDL